MLCSWFIGRGHHRCSHRPSDWERPAARGWNRSYFWCRLLHRSSWIISWPLELPGVRDLECSLRGNSPTLVPILLKPELQILAVISQPFSGATPNAWFEWVLIWVLQMDIISSLLSGRLVREKVGPAVQSAVQSQVCFSTWVAEIQTYWDYPYHVVYIRWTSSDECSQFALHGESRFLRDRRHQRIAHGCNRQNSQVQNYYPRPWGRNRGEELLLGLPAGRFYCSWNLCCTQLPFTSPFISGLTNWRNGEEVAPLPPHVPFAMHR